MKGIKEIKDNAAPFILYNFFTYAKIELPSPLPSVGGVMYCSHVLWAT